MPANEMDVEQRNALRPLSAFGSGSRELLDAGYFTGGAIHDDHGKMRRAWLSIMIVSAFPRRKRADWLGCRIASLSRQLRRHSRLSAAAVVNKELGFSKKYGVDLEIS